MPVALFSKSLKLGHNCRKNFWQN